MFAFNLFKNAVRTAYREKKNQEELHYKMANPSPANLRDYCLICLAKGMSNADQQVFIDYFNPTNKYPSLEKAIERVELGRLKSLQQFILEKTVDPDELIVKLLAVLIDFNPRPYKGSDWNAGNQHTQQTILNYGTTAAYTMQKKPLQHNTAQDLEDLSQVKNSKQETRTYSATENIRRILELDLLKKQQKEHAVTDYCAQMCAIEHLSIPVRKPGSSLLAGLGFLISLIISSYWLSPKQYVYYMQQTYVMTEPLEKPQISQQRPLAIAQYGNEKIKLRWIA